MILRLIMKSKITLFLIFLFSSSLFSQGLNFDAYKKFKAENKNLTTEGFYAKYPFGLFNKYSRLPDNVLYLDSIDFKFKFTNTEKSLLNNHSFMVSERLNYENFWNAFEDIYNKDLPVFVSTDAILHALHKSFDQILTDIEGAVLSKDLKNIIETMRNKIPNLQTKYSNNLMVLKSVKDVDLYLSVGLQLLSKYDAIEPIIVSNKAEFKDILTKIENLKPVRIKLFSDTEKEIDFSQFTPRGHYYNNDLTPYFKAMMWLSRIEFYLTPPEPRETNPQTDEDIQRQIIDAVLMLKLSELADVTYSYSSMENLLKTLIGESDNVQFSHIKELMNELNFNNAEDLVNADNVKKFQDLLRTKSYADQKILSQILWADPTLETEIKPASAFMFMGQRFILDSYIAGNVVFDKVKALRMLPKSYDILFALGNNPAGDFLKGDLDKYNYAPDLAACRYLVDNTDQSYWETTFYGNWLNSLRKLNPPSEEKRKSLPEFMQTAAFWQEKMNTQLASWAQLRHDFILYAKQSYTGGNGCSYPYGYIEPFPEFYENLEKLANTLVWDLQQYSSENYMKFIYNYFQNFADVMVKLQNISKKELNNQPFNDEEKTFLTSVYSMESSGCVVVPDGWYASLYYQRDPDVRNFTVADVHTAPTDESGIDVGWVWHVGTGDINLGVFVAKNADNQSIAYCGPVMSYYDYVSLNFKRLNDEEWADMIDANDFIRPEFTDLYLAKKDSNNNTEHAISLPTSINDNSGSIANQIYIKNYPNPFSESNIILFSIPEGKLITKTSLSIFDINGAKIQTLYSAELTGGKYSLRWDGKDKSGNNLPNGVYIYQLNIDGLNYSNKVVIDRK